MTAYTHLVGADLVQSAARSISHSADTISQAALNLDGTAERLGSIMVEATAAMNRLAEALERGATKGLPQEVEASLDKAFFARHGIDVDKIVAEIDAESNPTVRKSLPGDGPDVTHSPSCEYPEKGCTCRAWETSPLG